MAARSGLRLRPSNVQEAAPAAVRGGKGLMAGPGAGQTSSKVAVSTGLENTAYGVLGSLLPASSKAAAAGHKGPVKGRSSKKAAASVGQEGRVDGLTTKKKAAGSPAATGGPEEKKLVCIEGDKPAEAADAAGQDRAEAPAEGKRLTELPAEEVAWILALVPPPVHHPDEEDLLKFFSREMVNSKMETLRQAAEAQETLAEEFLAFQSWMRKELDAHGAVMVDDEWLAGREQVRQMVREEYKSVSKHMDELFSESDYGSYSDMYDTDDEEEEEEEVALVEESASY